MLTLDAAAQRLNALLGLPSLEQGKACIKAVQGAIQTRGLKKNVPSE
jgi:hypothetical protein